MSPDTLYRKVQTGKRVRYEPVAEHVQWDAFPAGAHLVLVQPGMRSAMRCVDPDWAGVEAALKLCQDEAAKALRAESEPRPMVPMTARELKAYAAWKAVMGDDVFRMKLPSAMGYVEAVFRVISETAKKARG